MSYKVIVENDGEITIPEAWIADLGWRTGDDLEIESTDAGLIVRRSADGPQET